MKHIQRILGTITIMMLVIVIVSCSKNTRTNEKHDSATGTGEKLDSAIITEDRDPHPRDSGESKEESRGEYGRGREDNHGERGEESGTEYALNETYDQIRKGARLTLNYDEQSNSFIGTVENTRNKTLKRVRVEVHLSNGIELGPTTPVNLRPGEKRNIKLTATNKKFDKWSTHAEVGTGEHGGEGRGEHDREGRGEHGERGEGRGEHGGERGEGGEGHEGGDGHEGKGDGRSGAITPLGKRFKGIIDEFEVDMFYDARTQSVTGTIKNISSKKIFSVQTEHHLKLGKRTVAEMKTTKVGDLNPGEIRKTTALIRAKDRSRLKNGTFDGYRNSAENPSLHVAGFSLGGTPMG